MKLLTFDLSSQVGWTYGDHDDPRFFFGTKRLPKTGEDIGAFAWALDVWLTEVFERRQDLVVFESPILPSLTSLPTLRKLYGLAWHVEFACKVHGVMCEEADIGPVTKYMTGRGQWGKGLRKGKMIEAAERYGYAVKTDDEADAIGVRLWTIAEKWPDVSRRMGHDMGALGASDRSRKTG